MLYGIWNVIGWVQSHHRKIPTYKDVPFNRWKNNPSATQDSNRLYKFHKWSRTKWSLQKYYISRSNRNLLGGNNWNDDDILRTISTSISQKSSASLGNLIPMLPNMFEVGPAAPCCELYDSIRFLTMFRSTLTGRKSSSSSSMSSLFCLGILDGAGLPPVFVFCVGSAVCGLDCFFFLGGGFGLSMEFYVKRFNRIIILAQHVGYMQMICRWYAGDMQMICRWYVDDMQMICRWYVDDMQMICRWYADDMQMICRWYADDM